MENYQKGLIFSFDFSHPTNLLGLDSSKSHLTVDPDDPILVDCLNGLECLRDVI